MKNLEIYLKKNREKINKNHEEELLKCLKKRGVKSCEECCRCEECRGTKPKNFPNVNIDPLIGAIVWSALVDYFAEIPPLKKCKTRAQREHRNELLYYKATAENFFKSKLFKYTNLDFEWLRRAYEKKKIQEE